MFKKLRDKYCKWRIGLKLKKYELTPKGYKFYKYLETKLNDGDYTVNEEYERIINGIEDPELLYLILGCVMEVNGGQEC